MGISRHTPEAFFAEIQTRLGLLERRLATTPGRTILTQGSTALRDATYGVPATDAQRVALANQVPTWFNTDRGWLETYYTASDKSGLLVKGLLNNQSSGWYPTAAGALMMHRGKTNGVTAVTTSPTEVALNGTFQVNKGGFTSEAYSATTVPLGGMYRLTSRLYFTGGSSNLVIGRLQVNSGILQDGGSARIPGQDAAFVTSIIAPLAAGDVLRLLAWASAADTYTYGTTGNNGCYLEAEYLGPPLATP